MAVADTAAVARTKWKGVRKQNQRIKEKLDKWRRSHRRSKGSKGGSADPQRQQHQQQREQQQQQQVQQQLLPQLEQQFPQQLPKKQALSARGSVDAAPRIVAATSRVEGPAHAPSMGSLHSAAGSPSAPTCGALVHLRCHLLHHHHHLVSAPAQPPLHQHLREVSGRLSVNQVPNVPLLLQGKKEPPR